MTDPTGLCFLSYRRARAAEASLLIAVLRDRGIPTWQDIADFATTPTEEALRRVLADPGTASAIMFATPEVEHSPVIRDIEAPAIVARHLRGDGFFAVPVAAGGLDYADMPRVLGPHLGLTHLPGWNILRIAADPADEATAASIADLVLEQRLATIHARLPVANALRVMISTRAPLPKAPGPALAIDLTHRFTGRVATADAWATTILPGLRSIVRAVQSRAAGRDVELSGLVAIPAAVAVGAAFLSLAGVRITWCQDQQSFGKPSAIWGLHHDREPSGFQVVTHPRTVGASDIALLVSVAADVDGDFNLVSGTMPSLRAVISVARPASTSNATRPVLTAGQALDVAHLAIDALRATRSSYQARGTVHLFLAVPVGLAMMIGQLLNTFGQIQTYEHIPGVPIPYLPAAKLTPSF